jgi:hypothetical protein
MYFTVGSLEATLEADVTVKRSPMYGSAYCGLLNSTRILGLIPLGTAGVGDNKSKAVGVLF